jgi:hypothetical protein
MAANLKTTASHHNAGSKFRVVESVLKRAPNVVSAQPRGLDGAVIGTTVEDVVNLDMIRANPFPPGTRAYIAHAQKVVPFEGEEVDDDSEGRTTV